MELSVGQREIACIVGPNGSGKSTLLSILAGLLRPDSGRVLFGGKPLKPIGSGRQIGFVPQKDSLFEELTVADNLAFWSAAAKVSLREALARPSVTQLELKPMLKKRVGALSGGMRQRISLAVGLLANPTLLILDEPFAGLDLFFKRQLITHLTELRKDGVTILYTSHNADEIAALCDRVFLLMNGKIALTRTLDTLPSSAQALNQYIYTFITGETI
ncbi:ABC transporter ATP-binding protein [Oscillospiraceae bacterium MB08-C2-2]|nr:ABC transporter ATP-binding protein [Oscillospiraceae bacterium MB08-C2-2]